MQEPQIDHIIAVHDPSRPIARAVASVLDHNSIPLRVTVVCHNLDSAVIRSHLRGAEHDPRCRLIELHDDVPSPSGPFNAGLDAATARFTSIMGSDDELEPGALDSWARLADRTGADVVVPRMRIAGGGFLLTPPARPGRTRHLDGVKDRLAYRTSPLGLVSRRRFGDERFPPGLRSGEDVDYVARLWYSRAEIAWDRRGPAYIVHADAVSRVSTVTRPLRHDTAFLRALLSGETFARLDARQQTSLVVKTLRLNVMTWIRMRPEASAWTDDDLSELRDALALCDDAAPQARRYLSRTDRDILEAVAVPECDLDRALTLVRTRTSVRVANLVPRRLRTTLAREAPLRFAVASKLVGI